MTNRFCNSDVIEVNAAHGYLVSEFLSPTVNRRTDEYGGSFKNRIRFLLEIIREVRGIMPQDMPLFVRVSGTEWMEWTGQLSWDVPSTIALAKSLPDLGVDLIDVSSGGIVREQKIHISPYYQVNIAGEVRKSMHEEGMQLFVGAVGMITNGEMARSIVQDGVPLNDGEETQPEGERGIPHGTIEVEEENVEGNKTTTYADIVSLGRQFLREPEFAIRTAIQLGVKVALPVQYSKVL
jgi:2,4-dienoyl-CoA reductase-like NADH-dependent reductase (Old Yellow Enzyme family)